MGEIIRTPQPDSGGPPVVYRPAAATVPEDGIDMRRVVEATYRRRRTLLVTFLVALLTATAGAVMLPRVYMARTSVLVQPSSSTAHLEGEAGYDPRLVENQVETLREFIRSQNFMVPTLKRLGMLDEAQTPKEKESTLRAIQSRLAAKATGANTFEVTFSGKDPVWPVRLVDGIVTGFLDVSMRTRANNTAQAVEFIEAQMADYRRRMAESQDAIKRFQAQNADLLAQTPDHVSGRLSRAEDGLIEARMSAMDAQVKINLIQKQLQNTTRTVVDDIHRIPSARVTAFRASLSAAEAAYESLRARYTDEHPEVRAKLREVENLRAQLADALKEPDVTDRQITRVNTVYSRLQDELMAAQNQLRTASERERQFQRMLAPAENTAKQVPLVRQKLDSLTAEARTQEAIYDSLVGRLEFARLANQMEARQQGALYQLIDPARIVASEDGKRRLAIILGGAALGLLLGLSLSALQEVADHRVRSAEDLERFLAIPVLATIPLLPEIPHHLLMRRQRRLLLAKGAVAVVLVGLLFMLGTRTQIGQNFIRERVHPATAWDTGTNARVPAVQTAP